VCGLKEAIKTKNRYYLMLEYCNGGDLEELLKVKDYKLSKFTIHKIIT